MLVLCLLIICENLPNSNLILTDLSPLWEKLNLHYKGFNRSWFKSYFMKCFSYPRFLQAWRSFESRKLCYLPLSSFFIKPISRLYHYYKAIEQMEKREGNRFICKVMYLISKKSFRKSCPSRTGRTSQKLKTSFGKVSPIPNSISTSTWTDWLSASCSTGPRKSI